MLKIQRFSQILFTAVFVSIFMVSCGSNKSFTFQSKDKIFETYNLEKEPSKEDYPNQEAVIILDKKTINYSLDDPYLETHVIKKIFYNESDHAKASLYISYHEELYELKARTIAPDGTVSIVKDNDIVKNEIQIKDDNDVNTSVRYVISFPNVEPGSIVEYYWRKKTSLVYSSFNWTLQKDVPVLKTIYKLNKMYYQVSQYNVYYYDQHFSYIPELKYKIDKVGLDIEVEKSEYEEDLNVYYTWEFGYIPEFESDPHMLKYANSIANIKFSGILQSSWNSIAHNYYEDYFKPNCKITDKITEKAEELIKDKNTCKNKMQAIYTFVQNIRYDNVHFGERGIKPAEPETVLESGYGDCKDKSTLLIAMLNSVGIAAYPAILLTYDDGLTDPEIPTWRFNHMIVYAKDNVTDKLYWLDPTAKYSKVGDLPWMDEGARALVMYGNKKSQFLFVPTSKTEDNLTKMDCDVNIYSRDSVEFDVKYTFSGKMNRSIRYMLEQMKQDNNYGIIQELIDAKYIGIELDTVIHTDLDSIQEDMQLSFKFITNNAISKTGDLLFLEFDINNWVDNLDWLRDNERKFPINYYYTRTKESNININLKTDKLVIADVPKAETISNDYYNYNKDVKIIDRKKIGIMKKYSILKREIPAGKYSVVKDFFKAFKQQDDEKIMLMSINN